MPRRISRLGGTTLRRSFMTNAYSPAIYTWGPRHGPQSPHHSGRPGGAVAVLYLHGGPDMAPNPPTFGPPRRSRGGPLFTWGPRHGPQSPNVRAAPAEPWRPSIYMGAPTWPPIPQRSGRPGGAVAALYFRRRPISGGARASCSGPARRECPRAPASPPRRRGGCPAGTRRPRASTAAGRSRPRDPARTAADGRPRRRPRTRADRRAWRRPPRRGCARRPASGSQATRGTRGP